MSELWAPQQRGLNMLYDRLDRGRADVIVTLPTGGGKTRMMQHVLSTPRRQLLLTGRKMLFEQTMRVMEKAGIEFGVRASGYRPDNMKPIQLAMIQTEYARRGRLPKHDCEIVHVDEAHSHKANMMAALRDYYSTASWVGWTATPLDIGEWYDELIVAGNMTDLRACGAVVPCLHYGPDEPDLKGLKRADNGDYAEDAISQRMMAKHTILGRVIDNWRRLNEREAPTILFAPGVQESLWFAEHLWSKGIRSAHIDGDNIWMDGTTFDSDAGARTAVAELSKAGEIKIVCNRFVLREGIDWPWIEHGIFATVFGSLKAYLQSGGRILRQHYVNDEPQLKRVTIQDHGGNWWRHGSLNSDRVWEIEQTDYIACELREQRLRDKKIQEPIRCPRCHAIRLSGKQCPACGYEHTTRSRMVVQANGELKEMVGDILKPRTLYRKPDLEREWERCYWRAYNTGMTFNKARGLFAYEHNYKWPPNNLPLMPIHDTDWFERVNRVPKTQLIGRSYAQANGS